MSLDLAYLKDKPRILVVDDLVENIELFKAFLNPEYYTVETACDGEEALNKVEEFSPDLILLDIMMPKLNGYEVCRTLKSRDDTRLIMIVIVTAHDEVESRLLGIELGADDYIVKPFNKMLLCARIKSLLKSSYYYKQFEAAERVILSLGMSIEAKDPYTEGHCERLAKYSVMLGRKLGLNRLEIKALRQGSVLHDIGKVGIRDTILLKDGPLDKEEMDIMKTHPVIGERICKPLKSLSDVLPIIRHHHERGDGSGYPDGLTFKEIPISVKILQIVDVYDALKTERPYKRSLKNHEAFQIMEEETKKGWWDKEIFYEFKNGIMARY